MRESFKMSKEELNAINKTGSAQSVPALGNLIHSFLLCVVFISNISHF